ncbi:uncharacterized protein LOC112346643 [Selaginella moellendorffii]|uniref:uncharacterized protein LOC112346643 n=1 Tax=Selaginella moellendorffii TaxID=88036 RepID=UPI000D1C6B3A|nr:uncharacterized protein LOC112346643 [Selaginella moellendorffii]XP_024531862.1 uncharacterized protein LOC112346643 [Selaginella moellendorffii]|eukprot:XP_024531861.1 uncharacterized protein LOC112346643 [Selaginella moellendorffii]
MSVSLIGASLVRRALRIRQRQFSSLASGAAQPENASSRILEEDVKKFEEDGAVVLRKAIPSSWVEQLRVAADNNMKNPGPLCDEHVKPGEPGRFHDDQFLWLRHNTMRSFIFESPVGEIAKGMMRGKLARLFYDQLLVKEPGTRTTTPWHNDHSYWQLSGDQVISVWLALDPVPESSCVQYVKGSHKWRLLHRIASFSGDEDRYKSDMTDSLPDIPNIDEKLDELTLLKWDMEPGDCLIHHSFAVHGAPGIGEASGRRRGYATRWVGESVKFDPRPGTMHYVWLKAGIDAALQPGESMDSHLFPHVC